MIVIINYGLGNVGSIYNMLKYIGIPSKVSENLDDIKNATKLILPGVGAFDFGMKLLQEKDYIELLNKKVLEERVPIVGICLGMQLMFESSEEGVAKGLSWVQGNCIKFRDNLEASKNLKVPHMGWNDIFLRKKTDLFDLVDNELRFYFAHSYHLTCNENYILAESNYGYTFPVVIKKDNILGVQFHPEKSHIFGMNFFKSFSENNF